MSRDNANIKVTASRGKVYLSWDGNKHRASYTVDEMTGHVVDNVYTTVTRSDAAVLQGLLKAAGYEWLADQVWRNYRHAD